jgi:abequosyltransferase
MKKLAICIPNYNRIEKLKRLLINCSEQILEDNLTDKVEICINDDCSTQKPDDVIESIKNRYPEIEIRFSKNNVNRGMDYNFLQSVKISDGEFCWIIGNDDLPTENGIETVINHLEKRQDMDILVGPFDSYDEDNSFIRTCYPLKGDINEDISFDTRNHAEYDSLIDSVNNCNAVFGFLSNVVFKKTRWIEHGNMFNNKMNTIFIQMYMNLQTLKEGAVYTYTPDKFIKNYTDDVINETFKREYDVTVGLKGVVDYFFSGESHTKLQNCIVNPRINGRMWDLPDDSPLKKPILHIKSYKNELYRKYFVKSECRKTYFKNKYVLIYGAGNMGKKAITDLKKYDVNIMAVIDSDMTKVGKRLEGYIINHIDYLEMHYFENNCIVVVANCNSLEEIIDMLLEKNINNIAIIT